VSADARKAIGVAEEVNDFLHLVLRLVHAGDVLEGDHGIAALGDSSSPGIWNAAGRRPIHRETNQAEERRDRGDHPVTKRLRVGHRIDFDTHVVLHEVGDERRVCRQELGRGHRLPPLPIAHRHLDLAFTELDGGDGAIVDLLKKLGEGERLSRWSPLLEIKTGRDGN
jgi:hypothetical protein